jgi:hypothetical protein
MHCKGQPKDFVILTSPTLGKLPNNLIQYKTFPLMQDAGRYRVYRSHTTAHMSKLDFLGQSLSFLHAGQLEKILHDINRVD